MKRKIVLLTALLLVATAFSYIKLNKAFAATTIDSVTVDPKDDFVLEPGKAEIFLNPGDSTVRDVYVTDRIPGSTTFKVEVDDIEGSQDPNQPVVILENGEKGPYSGRDFIVPDTDEFTLQFGQRITIPITITIPKDASPGGYYSTVLISNEPEVLNATSSATDVAGGTKVISRVGVLYFLRVNGQANESGNLSSFTITGPKKLFYESGPFTFDILFNNNGNVHLVPYGTVTIKNILGKEIAELPVDAYFSLPNSLRDRQVTWDQGALFGRYTATLVLNRGYNSLSDTKTIAFWVLPWKFILALFIALFVIIAVIFLFLRTFELRRK
jgi:hypothetical protein